MLKLDCEGAEYDIVDASPDESWRRVQRVVMEYHPAPPGRYEALRERFAALGFAVVQEDRYAPGLGALWMERARR